MLVCFGGMQMLVNGDMLGLEKVTGPGYTILGEAEHPKELDFQKVRFVTMLLDGEECITGEDRLSRLKKCDLLRLCAGTFLFLMENQHLIPESWKEVDGNTRFIYFDGTVLERSNGDRCVMFMFWLSGRWTFSVRWLNNLCNNLDCSAIAVM